MDHKGKTGKDTRILIRSQELLLNYSNRFYNRQFITRKAARNNLLVKVEELLTDYFNADQVRNLGVPTVHYVSDQLHVSPNYLSDMLRTYTGHKHNSISILNS